MLRLILITFLAVGTLCNDAAYKYTQGANDNKPLKLVQNPFRMQKLNLLWEKAVKRLADGKLKSLMSELKIQDKDELTLKKLKSEAGDKEGLKEAEIRRKLKGIMTRYNLLLDGDNESGPLKENYLNEVGDDKMLHAIFKDKKINKLWLKAEQSGFTEEELKALKEEFQHHQDKIDEYYAFINAADDKSKMDMKNLDNEITPFDEPDASEKSAKDKTNTVREKHRELKEGYDRLHKVTSTGPETKEFIEPKVSGLWKLAVRGDFTQEELESLHTELKHYEHRLLKVRHLTGQMNAVKDRGLDGAVKDRGLDGLEKELHSTEGQRILQERISKQKRKVDKLHEDLEMRILQRHSEL